jgi:nucleoid DNA-binding protein
LDDVNEELEISKDKSKNVDLIDLAQYYVNHRGNRYALINKIKEKINIETKKLGSNLLAISKLPINEF